jgi:hypothetical protein
MSQFNLIGYSNSGANVFNNLTITENGAMVVPYGVSSERPVAPVAGMLRYLTTDNLIEYYNGTAWLSVSQQPPNISSITPQYVQDNISDNSINIIGDNFSINPFVQFISSVDDSVISAQSSTFNSESSITAVISNTMRDLSSLYPFSVKVTNQSSLNSTLGNALFWNEVPTFTTAQSPTVYAEIGEGTGQLTGQLDLSAVDIGGHLPLIFSSSDLNGNTSGNLTLDNSGAITGNASSLSPANYNFSAKVTDTNEGFTLSNFTFTVKVAYTATTTGSNITTSYVDSGNNVTGSATYGGYTIIVFESTNPNTITPSFSSSDIKYLVLGGGGGTPGTNQGSPSGGGGAGGYRTNYGDSSPNISFVASTSYSISVGGGGSGGGVGDPGGGSSGGASSLAYNGGTITSSGGGRGGYDNNAGFAGGSGGGGSLSRPSGSGNSGGYTPPEGFSGGNGEWGGGLQVAGGGGGASAVGGGGLPSGSSGGAGGSGRSSTITGGAGITRGGGGAGASWGSNARQGGSGGGGNQNANGLNGSGGGAGGAGATNQGQISGKAGGTGIVIVRFPSFSGYS